MAGVRENHVSEMGEDNNWCDTFILFIMVMIWNVFLLVDIGIGQSLELVVKPIDFTSWNGKDKLLV